MKLKKSQQAMLSSYGRSFAVAAATYVAQGDGVTLQGLLLAGVIAVAGPALRAVNPKDPAFGLIANVVDSELKKLSEKAAPKKKAAKKSPKKSSGGGTPADHL
jgi:hypothetical protein